MATAKRLDVIFLVKLRVCVMVQEARQKFRSVLVEATVKLDELVKKMGKAVEESKPYWEARRLARQVSHLCPAGEGRTAEHTNTHTQKALIWS